MCISSMCNFPGLDVYKRQILSATSQAANQNAWIDAMKKIMEEDDKYSKLELVEVASVSYTHLIIDGF